MARPKIILGISFSHGDSSAALIADGCLIAAAEEERFTRIKHYALFPNRSIAYCLKHGGISPKEVRIIAIARRPSNAFRQKFLLFLRHPNLLNLRAKPSREPLGRSLNRLGLRSMPLVRVEHHMAHLMSARYLAGGGPMALMSFDGLGDFVSATIARATKHSAEILERVYFPHSLGYFYTAMTQYLGFPHFGDEYKMMGLSSYGQPRHLNTMRELIRENDHFGFQLNLEAFALLKTPMHFAIERAQPKFKPFYSSSLLTQVLGIAPRKITENLTRAHWDLARSVQVRFEEVANHLLHQLHERVGGEMLGLAGGCAHNSVWVGQIPKVSPFKKIHVAPASNDAGIAVGAAIVASNMEVSPRGKHWALLGPELADFPLEDWQPFSFDTQSQEFPSDEALIRWLVEELNREKIIGIVRGRMEFGPRALGNRSILCDPRVPTMKDRLNERIKHRELFRPFAASVLWEYQQGWFHHSFFSPAMEAVFEVKENVRSKIPAVVHVDNTCRIQSVTFEAQPFFWGLLDAFRKRTGIPLLLNTSLNDREPIVCTPKDALECFSKCEMDHMVIGMKVISRHPKKLAMTG